MHGGYPQATGYRLHALNTNLEEIFKNREDYPLGDPDPSNGEFERMIKGEIVRKPYCNIYPITLNDYDLVHYCESGGPGYGDPLEREVESIIKDLDDGFYTKDIVFNVYGVVAEFDKDKEKWILDEKTTKKRRDEMKKERVEKSLPFEEYWENERKKITDDKLSEIVKRCYSESLMLSKNWAKEFRNFWKFPDNFQIEVK
jgi:hypothetical protein